MYQFSIQLHLKIHFTKDSPTATGYTFMSVSVSYTLYRELLRMLEYSERDGMQKC